MIRFDYLDILQTLVENHQLGMVILRGLTQTIYGIVWCFFGPGFCVIIMTHDP